MRTLCVFTAIVASAVSSSTADEKAKGLQTIRVASLSIFPAKWDKASNADKIESMVRKAAKEDVELIITPEGVLEGYVVNEVIREEDAEKKRILTESFQKLAEPRDGPYLKRFCALANELNVHLVLGFLESDGGKTYNSAGLINPEGELIGVYRKTHFAQGYVVNPPGYTAGQEYPVFDIGQAKIGMMICFDRQPPEPARSLALGGAEIIVCPSYGGRGDWNTRLMQVRAYENSVPIVFTHPQQSLIIDRNGELLKECEEDSYAIYDLPIRSSKKRNSVTNRRPETYRSLSTDQ